MESFRTAGGLDAAGSKSADSPTFIGACASRPWHSTSPPRHGEYGAGMIGSTATTIRDSRIEDSEWPIFGSGYA